MTVVWDDVNARARGLSTHLLGRPRLERLAGSADLGVLAAELDRLGYGPSAPEGAGAGSEAAGIELALRRGAAERLRTLRRWCGDRVARLAVLFEDEDRRSLRALLRGAVAGAPAEMRLAGLIPTPALPVRALQELALQRAPAKIAALLVFWRNPYGPDLLAEAQRAHPDLLLLDRAINRRFAGRALLAARRGGRPLLDYARELIDLENASTALVLAGGPSELQPADCFIPGGGHLGRPAFLEAAGAVDRAEAAGRLAAAFAGTAFGEMFGRVARDPGGLESLALQAQIDEQTKQARLDPLDASRLLDYALRLRAELLDLRRIVWGLALGVPSAGIEEGLVTPA